MFSPAAQKVVPLSREVAFLLSYRAIAYEKFLKEAALRSKELHRQEADKGRPFAEQASIQTGTLCREMRTRTRPSGRNSMQSCFRCRLSCVVYRI
jgi:hypothetical protein